MADLDQKFKCPECDQVFEGDSITESRLYECGECGDVYSREQTEGGNNRCPQCNKAGSRVDSNAGKKGKLAGDVPVCPDCENIELEAFDGAECDFCTDEIAADDMKEHLLNRHIDDVLEHYIDCQAS